MTISPELTFLPAKAPHYFTTREAAQQVTDKVNAVLKLRFGHLALIAKADCFPGVGNGNPHLIEVIPVTHWDEWNFNRCAQALDALFRELRTLGLVPTAVKAGRTERHYPNGGCHFHIGMNLFEFDSEFYTRMSQFHANLAVDYANRPYVKWLFAQWFDDKNSATVFNEQEFIGVNTSTAAHWAHNRQGVMARFAKYHKDPHPTFEFRFFSMGDAKEVGLMASFLICWVNHIRKLNEPLKLSITPRDFQLRFRNPRVIEKEMAGWFTELGLEWQCYRPFFTRNYLNRLRFGKLC